MFPVYTSGPSGRIAGNRRSGAFQRQPSEDEIARESETYAALFLDGHTGTVRIISEWARSVAAHRVWGFENAEDIVQATLLALVQNLREGKFSGGNLRAYVRRIAKNMCIDTYRKARARGNHVSLEESGRQHPARRPGDEMEHSNMIERILERLSEACRRIILLAYVHGYSRREISFRLGISEEAARVRLFRCIRNARALLNGSNKFSLEHA